MLALLRLEMKKKTFIEKFEVYSKQVTEIEIVNDKNRTPLNNSMRDLLCKVVDGGRRSGKCIEIGDVGEGNGIAFTFKNPILDISFNVFKL